jgi:hypothetical protein
LQAPSYVSNFVAKNEFFWATTLFIHLEHNNLPPRGELIARPKASPAPLVSGWLN